MQVYFYQIKDLGISNSDEFKKFKQRDKNINENYWAYVHTYDDGHRYDSWDDDGELFASLEEAMMSLTNTLKKGAVHNSVSFYDNYQCYSCYKSCTTRKQHGTPSPVLCKYYLFKADWVKTDEL